MVGLDIAMLRKTKVGERVVCLLDGMYTTRRGPLCAAVSLAPARMAAPILSSLLTAWLLSVCTGWFFRA